METKPLLFGLIGFLLGGLLVSFGGTVIHKRGASDQTMTMSQMNSALKGKTGDDFDKLFLSEMIDHHQAAIDMAKLAQTQAKHPEVKQLANDIASTQSKEIDQMQSWQEDWGYAKRPTNSMMNMGH
ncbi:MAG: hypothetical protein NVS3B29_07900 [Candidatus Saccharimonadales bacterium]